MIKYALQCHDCEAEFEAWFASSSAYDDQAQRGLVSCPSCNSTEVRKAIMAPAVSGTKKTAKQSDEAMFRKMVSAARRHVAENFEHVGDGFADKARAMHYGTADTKPIWGTTTPEEREQLQDEGVPAEPLHPALVPDVPTDDDQIN